MPLEMLMPKLGLTMTEGKIVEWRKNEGDSVTAGEIIFVLETEKVTYEVEAPEDGVLGRILVGQEETVPVGAVVAYLLRAGESLSDIPATPEPSPRPVAHEPTQAPVQEPSVKASDTHRVRATPLAKKIARELGVDLSLIAGTGPSARIVADDVRNATASTTPLAAAEEPQEKLAPFTGMRRTIAANMMAAKVETAQTYMSVTTDATAVVHYRKALLEYVEAKYRVRLTVTDLMMKITGAAISDHPVINTRWTEQGVLFLPGVHMGMAMALEEGLIVPVIRDINSKTLGQIAVDRVELIKRGKENRFLPDDIKGSTFTLSTLGMFGIESFTANINRPESAILAVGAIIEKPVAVDGQIVIRPMMNVTLTYDHRIIDGAEAGKFMRSLKDFIENPVRLLA